MNTIKMLAIALLVTAAFTPMFLKVHAKARALESCVQEYNPTPEMRSEVVDVCMEAINDNRNGARR